MQPVQNYMSSSLFVKSFFVKIELLFRNMELSMETTPSVLTAAKSSTGGPATTPPDKIKQKGPV